MAGVEVSDRWTGPQRAGPERPRAYEGHVIGAVSLALALALLWLIWLLARPIGLLLAAVIVANALEPVADYLMRWMRRTYAIVAIYLALFAVGIVALALVVPGVTDQVNEFVEDVPALIERGRQLVEQWGPVVGGLGSSVAQWFGGGGDSGGGGGSSMIATLPLVIASSVFEGFLVCFLSLYWLVALPTLRGFLLSLIRPDHQDETRAVLREIGETMGGYVRGVIMEAALIGALVYCGLWLIGVRYAAVLAAVAAVGEFVPYVGPIIAAVPAVLLTLFESPSQALVVAGFYVVLQLLESYVLFPLVVGSQSDIPPLLIIVGLLAGGTIGGVLGALVAVPLAGAVRVIVLRLAAPAMRGRTGGTEQTLAADERQ